jgi:GntR family transcriptional regulator, transcriptional repressor for pyruvate dehydrogenase complex
MSGADMPADGMPEKAERARTGTLVDKVHAELHGRIRRGEFPPGSKLPGEHELASLFCVSRPVIRDVLGRLRDEGLITSRQGAGSFVQAQAREPGTLGFTPVESIADIQRCYEFRLTIEPDAAFLAATRRNAAALDRIAEALALLQEATSHHLHREDADFSFHKAITEGSNNHYYVSSIEALKQHISVGMHFHGLSLLRGKPSLKVVLEEHRAIYHAVRDGKPEDARDAMRRHLEGSRNRLFEGRMLDLSL